MNRTRSLYWLLFGLLAGLLAFGGLALATAGTPRPVAAAAAAGNPPRPPPTRTPWATRTPCATVTVVPPCPPPPVRLVPWLQFGHAAPGNTVTYRQVLLNRVTTATTVDLAGRSLRGWPVTVDPTQVVAVPGLTNTLTIGVAVPVSPTARVDVERVRASAATSPPFTTTAYLITLAGRVPFTDLAPTDWADDPVQYLVAQGAVAGYADGSFRPADFVTRAQFAKMLVSALGWTLQYPAQPTFVDVPPTAWAYPYIETAAAQGVIGGYSDGTFRPAAPVTRAQVAKLIVTARGWCQNPPAGGSFSDVSPQDWFYPYATTASAAQSMAGYGDGTFRPYALATRAQV